MDEQDESSHLSGKSRKKFNLTFSFFLKLAKII